MEQGYFYKCNKHFLKMGKYYRAYMIINNLIEDYQHYIEPDSIIHDGAIDVFEVRSQKANTAECMVSFIDWSKNAN